MKWYSGYPTEDKDQCGWAFCILWFPRCGITSVSRCDIDPSGLVSSKMNLMLGSTELMN